MKKQFRKSVFTLILGFLGIGSSFGQTIPEGTEQIFIRTYEGASAIFPSGMVISYGNDLTEKIDLQTLTKKNWEGNAEIINKALLNIRKAGYRLISSTAGGSEAFFINTYVFVKTE